MASAATLTSLSPSVGCVGTAVRITGANFTAASTAGSVVSAVKFGTVAAKFTVNSATQITAIVPPSAVTGNVVLTNATGDSSAVVFTVEAQPGWAAPKATDSFAQYAAANVNTVSTVPEIQAASDVTASVAHATGYTVSVKPMAGQGKLYQWYKDGIAVAGATSPSYLYTSGTSQTVVVFQCKVYNSAGAVWSNLFNITLT